jgi:uncharacterized protein
LYAFWWEPSSLRLRQYDVPAPAPLKGLKIAVIADLHAGSPYIDADKIDRIVAMTNAAKPDLILMTGDYVLGVHTAWGGWRFMPRQSAPHLRKLRAPLGVWAAIGNHDRWENAGDVAEQFGKAGIGVLENRHVILRDGRGPLYLAGVGDFHTGASRPQEALSGIAPGSPAICFTHSPDVFPQLPPTCALTIAGHTHGGQVWMLGRLVVPSRYGARYLAGTVQEDGKTLFVSSGIGTSILPVRFGVPPEISLLRLH